MDERIGLSWFIGAHRRERIVCHSGEDTGFQSFCALFPERNAGVVWMANWDALDDAALTAAACDAALGIV